MQNKKILLCIVFVVFSMSCKKSIRDDVPLEKTIDSSIPKEQQSIDKKIEKIIPEFKGLNVDEEVFITYEKESEPTSNSVEILINAKDNQHSRLIARLPAKNTFGDAKITMNKVYYLYGDPTLGGYSKIKYFDLNKGVIVDLEIPTYGTYNVSGDDQFLLFQTRGKEYRDQWGSIFIPILKVMNLMINKEYTFDFSDSFLQDGFGVTISSKYFKDVNAFYIEFSQDAPANIGKGYIHLDTMKFELIE